MFDRAGGVWSEVAKLTAPDAAANDRFGRSVAVQGDRIIVGAANSDTNGMGSGSAYVFDLAPPEPADLIQGLVASVFDLNLQQGIENSLDAKLGAATGALEDVNTDNDQAAINSLQAFINSVEAQRGNSITEEDADALAAAAQLIIDLLTQP